VARVDLAQGRNGRVDVATRSGGVALSIGISVIIGFSYGILFYVFLFLGKSGLLPPFLSSWIPTTLFGLAGIFTLMSVRQ